jgi:hypothetical protein
MIGMSRNRARSGAAPAVLGRSTRMSRSRSASADGPLAPGFSSPRRTKSEFGSKITTGSAVCAMTCSSTTPSA